MNREEYISRRKTLTDKALANYIYITYLKLGGASVPSMIFEASLLEMIQWKFGVSSILKALDSTFEITILYSSKGQIILVCQ